MQKYIRGLSEKYLILHYTKRKLFWINILFIMTIMSFLKYSPLKIIIFFQRCSHFLESWNSAFGIQWLSPVVIIPFFYHPYRQISLFLRSSLILGMSGIVRSHMNLYWVCIEGRAWDIPCFCQKILDNIRGMDALL